MKDKLNDTDIDRIFRDSIESAEAEPSENFWNKAYEGIISRENSIYQKRMATWRNAAIALGLIVMGLVGYNVYMTGKVDNLGKQISDIEKFNSSNNSVVTQNQAASNVVASNNNNTANKNNEASNHVSSGNNQPLLAVVNHSAAINASVAHHTFNTQSQVKHSENQNNNIVANLSNNNINIASKENQNNTVANVSNNNVNTVSTENQNNDVVANVSNNNVNVASSENLNTQHATENNANTSNEQVAQHNPVSMLDNNANKTAPKVASTDEETKTKPTSSASDIIYPDVNASSSSLDTINDKALLSSSSKSKGWFAEKVMPNVSVSVFGAPVIASTVMNGYSVVDNLSAVQLTSREHQQLGYVYGANLGYNISPKVTIEAGFSYRSNQFTIDPATLYPHSGDVAQAYHFVTSSGTITMPYLPNAKSGDSVTAKGSAVRSYISIPVQVKYNVFNIRHKLTIYATGGAAINILSTNKATVDYNNANGENAVSINSISGTNKTTYSYLIGAGAEYKIGKGFAIYAEPNYLGGITPINSSANIKAYSNYTNITVGLNYLF